jgi:hypothetical protein
MDEEVEIGRDVCSVPRLEAVQGVSPGTSTRTE